MFCSKCGSLLQDGVSFCSNCGNNVTDQIPVGTQGDAQPEFNSPTHMQDVQSNEQPNVQSNVQQPQCQPDTKQAQYQQQQYQSDGQQTQSQYQQSSAQQPLYQPINQQPQYQPYNQQPKKNYTLGIIIGVIAALALIGAIFGIFQLGKCTMTINSQDSSSKGDSAISAEASQYVGKWTYDASSYLGDNSSSLEDLYNFGDLCTLELYDNGTYRLDLMGESMIVPSSSTKWETTSSGISLSYDKQKYDLKYDKSKDRFTFEYEGTELVLKRSSDAKTNTVTL